MLTIISTLFFVACQAQADTAYIVNIDGQFYEVTQELKPVGDTSTITNLYLSRATDRARQFARAANEVWNKPDFVGDILNANQRLQESVGISIVKASVMQFGQFAAGTWSVELNGGSQVQGTMSVPASQNNLQLQIGGNTYQLLLIGDAFIRIQGYPSGSFTDLLREYGDVGISFRSLEEFSTGVSTVKITKQ